LRQWRLFWQTRPPGPNADAHQGKAHRFQLRWKSAAATGCRRATLVDTQTSAAVEIRMLDTNPLIAISPPLVTFTFIAAFALPARKTIVALLACGRKLFGSVILEPTPFRRLRSE